MRALGLPEARGRCRPPALQRAQALGLGVEGVLEVLEGQRVGEHRAVARRELGSGRGREGQRADRGECAAEQRAPRGGRLGGLPDGAVAVDGREAASACDATPSGCEARHHPRSPWLCSSVRTSAAASGASVAPAAGGMPPMSRIHAACRASTETIAHATASRSGVRLVIWPFSAGDGRVLEHDGLRDEGVVVGERVADVERRGGRGRGGAERGLERGDVVALVDQRGAGELGELTSQSAGADRALVERQLDALDAEQEAEDAQVLLARGRGAAEAIAPRPPIAAPPAAAADTAPPAESRNFLACERAQHEGRHRMVNSHRKRDH